MSTTKPQVSESSSDGCLTSSAAVAKLVLTSVPDEASARQLALALLEARVAACVSMLPPVRSVFRWKGAVEEAQECLLLIKTTQACWARLEAVVAARHPYEVPELLGLDVADVGLPYLRWLQEETS